MPPSLDACLKGAKTRGTPSGSPRFALSIALFLAAAAYSFPASAQKVRITNLSDVDFGLISNLQVDTRRSQNVCVFSSSTGNRYSIIASGSGTGSSFALSNGSNSLDYEVEWNDQSGQTTGTSLTATVTTTGRVSSATQQTCNSGPATSASLIVILGSAALSQAREGNYSGSLTLLIAAE